MRFLNQIELIRQKHIEVKCPFTGESLKLKWEFNNLNTSFIPLFLVECQITDNTGMYSKGYGDVFNPFEARLISFYEAFERYILVRKLTLDNDFNTKVFSSNGVAAGKNEIEAIDSSKNELIERKAVIDAWTSKSGWSKYVYKSKFVDIIKFFLETMDWNLNFYAIHVNSGFVLTSVLSNLKNGFLFDSKYVPKSKEVFVEKKLTTSMLKLYSMAINRKRNNDIISELPETGGPEDHFNYYLNSQNLDAISFLENIEVLTKGTLFLDDVDKIESVILFRGNELLPSVAISMNKSWLPLLWGSQSIKGRNSWPHPIA